VTFPYFLQWCPECPDRLPFFNLVRNSVIHSPSLVIRDPRYGNVSTCSSHAKDFCPIVSCRYTTVWNWHFSLTVASRMFFVSPFSDVHGRGSSIVCELLSHLPWQWSSTWVGGDLWRSALQQIGQLVWSHTQQLQRQKLWCCWAACVLWFSSSLRHTWTIKQFEQLLKRWRHQS